VIAPNVDPAVCGRTVLGLNPLRLSAVSTLFTHELGGAAYGKGSGFLFAIAPRLTFFSGKGFGQVFLPMYHCVNGTPFKQISLSCWFYLTSCCDLVAMLFGGFTIPVRYVEKVRKNGIHMLRTGTRCFK
jgi:hypothetical protein